LKLCNFFTWICDVKWRYKSLNICI
jgi:hypothetical protein